MKKVIFGFLILGMIGTSCKDEKKEKGTGDSAPAVAVNIPFTVSLRAIVEKDDNFAVYYNEEGKDDYKPEDVVIVTIKGSPNPQNLLFKMEEGIAPTNLRFDMGANTEQKSVKIESFSVINGSKSFTADGKDFTTYFSPNTQVNFDAATGTANFVSDGKSHTPIFLATPNLQAEIVKLYN
ncbi:MAG TPA: hypothetical protein VF581_05230 [Flavobacterium sp.]|jgi:hypothetical protein